MSAAASKTVGASVVSGDYTREVPLVPIPNTIVKLTGPMIVPTSAKVGHRRILFNSKSP